MKKIVLTVLVSGLFVCARAQDIESILQQVEQNNKELQAIRRGNEVSELEIRGRNTLEDPSVEYSPFYVKGNDGMASSELVVSPGIRLSHPVCRPAQGGQTAGGGIGPAMPGLPPRHPA